MKTMTKEMLLQELEEMRPYYYDSKVKDLCIKCVRMYKDNDVDLKAVLESGLGVDIIRFIVECYEYTDFCVWLCENDFDIFKDFRYADIVYREDYESEEDFKENSGVYYGDDIDCLLYNEDLGVYVKSW